MTGIPAGRYVERLAAARRVAGAAGLDALLVGVGPDLRYLAGYARPAAGAPHAARGAGR